MLELENQQIIYGKHYTVGFSVHCKCTTISRADHSCKQGSNRYMLIHRAIHLTWVVPQVKVLAWHHQCCILLARARARAKGTTRARARARVRARGTTRARARAGPGGTTRARASVRARVKDRARAQDNKMLNDVIHDDVTVTESLLCLIQITPACTDNHESMLNHTASMVL